MWMKAKVCHQNHVILLLFTDICNASGFNFFLRCQFWYEINSFSLAVSDHLAGNLSKGLVTSHICWLRARVPHHVLLWYWELTKGFGTITSRGLLCSWLVHWLHFSGNLLYEIITATSYFHKAFLMYPCAWFQIRCLLLSVIRSLMRGNKTEQDKGAAAN